MNNPKLEGSNIIDCIPQTGRCPNNCVSCFYNKGFYRPLDTPLIPTKEEASGKIVRVNSGHDSNLQKELVLTTTKQYEHKFYNTSIPDFDFPAPVVFTSNPKDKYAILTSETDNLMMVRIRVNSWDIKLYDMIVCWYAEQDVPVVLTYMRYNNLEQIIEGERNKYVFKKNIINNYYSLREKYKIEIEQRYHEYPLVFTCGVPTGYCKDCGNCEHLYWRFYERT